MSTYTYRNISDQDLLVVGYGEVKAGKAFISDSAIINPSLRLEVNHKKKQVNKDTTDGSEAA